MTCSKVGPACTVGYVLAARGPAQLLCAIGDPLVSAQVNLGVPLDLKSAVTLSLSQLIPRQHGMLNHSDWDNMSRLQTTDVSVPKPLLPHSKPLLLLCSAGILFLTRKSSTLVAHQPGGRVPGGAPI